MALNKIKIGKYIETYVKRCNIPNLTNYDVSGINQEKEFFEPSNQIGKDTSAYKVVPSKFFACNLMHVGRDVVLPVAYNYSKKEKIVSPAYNVFRIIDNEEILSEYLFLYLKCKEKDRYFWFNTDGSVRDGMSWEDFTNVLIELPSIEIQQKYVDIYNALLENQKSYEQGLDDLKLTCDAYIENLRRDMECEEIGKYLSLRSEENADLIFKDNDVMGVSQEKQIIPTKSDTKGNDISKFTIIYPNDFVYNPRNGIAIGLNKKNAIISWNNTAFYINNESLLPQYLMLWFSRKEWDRKVKIDSWGSSTEVYSFDAMCTTKIPMPELIIQKSIANIYEIYDIRRTINENLKQQIKEICPILIKGSIEEGRKEV